MAADEKTTKRDRPAPDPRLDALEAQTLAIRLALAATLPDTAQLVETLLHTPRANWTTILAGVRAARRRKAKR